MKNMLTCIVTIFCIYPIKQSAYDLSKGIVKGYEAILNVYFQFKKLFYIVCKKEKKEKKYHFSLSFAQRKSFSFLSDLLIY